MNEKNKLETISNIYENIIIHNEIILKYKIENEEKIKIFGEIFVKTNKNNYKK